MQGKILSSKGKIELDYNQTHDIVLNGIMDYFYINTDSPYLRIYFNDDTENFVDFDYDDFPFTFEKVPFSKITIHHINNSNVTQPIRINYHGLY